MDRHARQAQLAGIGVEGQARVARAEVDVGLDGFAGEVAARYLAGAGVGCVRVLSEALAAPAREVDARVRVEVRPGLQAPGADEVDLGDPAAIELARGALLALRALRRAAGGP